MGTPLCAAPLHPTQRAARVIAHHFPALLAVRWSQRGPLVVEDAHEREGLMSPCVAKDITYLLHSCSNHHLVGRQRKGV